MKWKNMSTLKLAKSAGPDNIPAKIIRMAAKELAPSFTNIINKCIEK